MEDAKAVERGDVTQRLVFLKAIQIAAKVVATQSAVTLLGVEAVRAEEDLADGLFRGTAGEPGQIAGVIGQVFCLTVQPGRLADRGSVIHKADADDGKQREHRQYDEQDGRPPPAWIREVDSEHEDQISVLANNASRGRGGQRAQTSCIKVI